MSKALPHPDPEAIDLSTVLDTRFPGLPDGVLRGARQALAPARLAETA